MEKLLTGREVSAALNEKIKQKVDRLKNKGISPCLCVIRVGDNPGDLAYEKGAGRRCEMLGVDYVTKAFPLTISQHELLQAIEEVNRDPGIHGVLLFRPLPKHLDQKVIENALIPEKDVDSMTHLSMAGVYTGREIGFAPCTPQACMELLDYYGIDCTGKRAVIIGRSLVAGKPLAMMLLRRNATVTVCHTRTVDLPSVTNEADILFVAAGHHRVVGREHVRPGQVVIDVGINVDQDGNLCGDVDLDAVLPVVEAITPVPGGVGSVTTSVLVGHVVEAAARLCQN